MTLRAFHERTAPPTAYRALRILTLVVFACWLPLAAYSGFRAIVQVYDLDVQSTSQTLGVGTIIRASVVTSGRAHADIVLELRQDERIDTIGSVFVPGNSDGALDPRPRRGTLRVVLTGDHLAQLAPGPVTIRATAVGPPQRFRQPPPTITEASTTVTP